MHAHPRGRCLKETFLWRTITWSLGKQNIQAKKVYH